MHTILGINGVTGIEIAKELNARGVSVCGVSRRESLGNWEHREGDVMDLESVKKAIVGSEIVYCCIGIEYNLKIWQRDWLPLIENVIQACLFAKAKLIFVDNVYMYGWVKGTMTEQTPMNPTSEKGKVRKAIAEKLLDAFANRGLEGCIARAADFYGPNCDKSMVADIVFKNITKNKKMQWLGKTDKKHAFTFTPDIGKACVNLALSDKMKGDVWHLPTAQAITGNDFTAIVAAQAGVSHNVTALRGFLLSIVALFIPILREVKEMMYQYDEDYLFSSEKYEKAFGEKPTNYESGIKQTLEAYKL